MANESISESALGMIETRGLVAAIEAADFSAAFQAQGTGLVRDGFQEGKSAQPVLWRCRAGEKRKERQQAREVRGEQIEKRFGQRQRRGFEKDICKQGLEIGGFPNRSL